MRSLAVLCGYNLGDIFILLHFGVPKFTEGGLLMLITVPILMVQRVVQNLTLVLIHGQVASATAGAMPGWLCLFAHT